VRAIVNPDGLANQVEGATVMGLGAALFEAIHFEAGAITNGILAAYRVPRITDVPPVEVVLLDRRDLPSAGAGETPIIAIAPASRTRSSPRPASGCGRCPWCRTASSRRELLAVADVHVRIRPEVGMGQPVNAANRLSACPNPGFDVRP